MPLPYYIDPDPSAVGGEAYWIEGYADGDALIGASNISAITSSGASANFIIDTNVQFNIQSSSAIIGSEVLDGYILIAANTNMATIGTVVYLGATSIDISTIPNFVGNATYETEGHMFSNSAFSVSGGYAREGISNLSVSCIVSVIGREKWEPVPDTPEIWTPVG